MKPEHLRMTRMLGYCLSLGTSDGWAAFTAIATLRLSTAERVALAFSALNALDLDHRQQTAEASICPVGMPLPPFLGGMDEARFWASIAAPTERKAYALAAFEAMSVKDQNAFYQHIREMEIAA